MAEQLQGLLGSLTNPLAGIIPKDRDEINMLAAEQERKRQEAARILLESRQNQPTTVKAVEQPKAVAPAKPQGQSQADFDSGVVKVPSIGETIKGIFGSMFK
tara:strand:- start:1557 stop:1862 length:306 start_codon:yes stop_codon:yes gene_type:complete